MDQQESSRHRSEKSEMGPFNRNYAWGGTKAGRKLGMYQAPSQKNELDLK